MSTARFITDIRPHIGHTPLWLPGVSATRRLQQAPAGDTAAWFAS